MNAPNGGGDNGLSQLQQLLSAMLSALGTSWLPASGPGPEAALAAAATPLAQAAQIFSGAATQAGSNNPPVSNYTAIRGIAAAAITQASQDLQTAAASLSSFAQTATQWLTSSPSPRRRRWSCRSILDPVPAPRRPCRQRAYSRADR